MKIYLAGSESSEVKPIIAKGLVENAFVSYYYLRKGNQGKDKLEFVRKHCKRVIVDSGAHTFFSEMAGEGLSVSVHKKITKTVELPEDYFQRYKIWIKENWNSFDYAVELDIGEIVGQDVVERWRQELKDAGLYSKIITVYHPAIMTWQKYIEMLEDSQSKYVALEGDRFTRTQLNYNKLIKPCYERGIKVHGFAMVKTKVMDMYAFYSVDSTSWKSGCQYGAGKTITTTGIKNLRYKTKKDIHQAKDKTIIELLGTNKEVNRLKSLELTAKAYSKLQSYYTQLWVKRGIIWDK